MADKVRVLYLEGDAAGAKYVRNVLGNGTFELLEGLEHIARSPRLDSIILSDLPLTRLGRENEEWLLEQLVAGVGLLLVGGWNSFGRGLYSESRIAEHFPVRVEGGDDRINLSSGAVLVRAEDHPILEGLPFEPPPMIAGFNEVRPRRGAKVLLEARRVVSMERNTLQLAEDPDPILIASEMSNRALAIATDLAPHWSGGLTDWGEEMMRFADGTEIGTHYVQLLRRMVLWTAKRPLPALRALANQ